MDYSLAALKLFCGELKDVRPASASSSAATLFGILFQRAWLQGVLVSGTDEGRFLLDDGSDVVELLLSAESQPQQWKIGMYVMVVGPYVAAPSGGLSTIRVPSLARTPY
ncbi:OB-fold nucleic acid binding domain containing protein [Musa troglodytarum]|uniref:OB-fold nucleic acid binding domain containing protein n=1 Tax=Musa troglodytarum TaxID=320322 RepID=A0A9E7KUQ9_9LILI|nr:OB-fold nucleic acid binding domain containing protein [Musa troglodytarum]